MADLAATFHWPPEALRALTLTDLEAWHRLAIARSGQSGATPFDAQRILSDATRRRRARILEWLLARLALAR
jgi:hypothetical protein